MTGQVVYDYAAGDLLENRNTYFYTPWRGAPFLRAWREQREAASLDGGQQAGAHEQAQRLTPTAAALARIRQELAAPGSRAPALSLLDRLVQRFEVTKRLHAEYGPNWRPTDPDDYRLLEPYVLFAETLHEAYACTGALPYLNALLKCMDTLTALRDRLPPAHAARVVRLVAAERAHVDALASSLAGGGHGA